MFLVSLNSTFCSQTNVHGKNYDHDKRRHSGDVTLHRSMLDLKQREGIEILIEYLDFFI